MDHGYGFCASRFPAIRDPRVEVSAFAPFLKHYDAVREAVERVLDVPVVVFDPDRHQRMISWPWESKRGSSFGVVCSTTTRPYGGNRSAIRLKVPERARRPQIQVLDARPHFHLAHHVAVSGPPPSIPCSLGAGALAPESNHRTPRTTVS